MRSLWSVTAAGRYAIALAAIAGSIATFGAAKKSNFTTHEKAYYADPSVIEYIQPGLAFTIVSASLKRPCKPTTRPRFWRTRASALLFA